ncbi:MAG: 2-polyprenyl-6-methoxyphenol hydroxylase-like FAD-dependent oxidoreductase [Crocinitomix sp.]|jgi:2-polyprenyl-6-methoxyphenol hydroxylase-like FAD-dependent oxidoreductase
MTETDVIILGSGIAGLVLSNLLKREKVDHIVLDRIQKQKTMALAETLPPSALVLLDGLDLLSVFEKTALTKTYGYHALWGSGQLQTTDFFYSNPFKYGLKLNKQSTLNGLKKKVADCILSYDHLIGIDHSEKEVIVKVSQKKTEKTIKGKWIVDATGRNRALLHALNIPIEDYDDIMAFSCHLPKTNHPDLIHGVYTESFAQGWGIVSVLSDEKQVMTLFTRKSNGLHKQLSQYEFWEQILANTNYLKTFLSEEAPDQIIGKRANSSAAKYFSSKNWIAIGDAAFTFDPLSSHGITNAIYTAKKAVQLITADTYNTQQYHTDLNEIFMAYLATKNSMYQSEQRWPEEAFWNAEVSV